MKILRISFIYYIMKGTNILTNPKIIIPGEI